jgi:hypothetical protein
MEAMGAKIEIKTLVQDAAREAADDVLFFEDEDGFAMFGYALSESETGNSSAEDDVIKALFVHRDCVRTCRVNTTITQGL